MLDPNFLVNHPDAVKRSLTARGAADLHPKVDRIVELAGTRSRLIGERDELRNLRNTVSKQIGLLYREGKGDQAEALKAQVSEGAERVKGIEAELEALEAERTGILMELPNVLAEGTPDGMTEDDNPVQRTWGDIPAFAFEPKAHVEVGTDLGILDLERSAKLTGARFYVLTGMGARLERALINFYLDLHTSEHGYTEVLAPYIVHRRILEGTGQLPKFEADLFKLEGQLNGADAFLIPTAEVPVTNLHRDELLEAGGPPRPATPAYTPCFRTRGRRRRAATRAGLLRVHQFDKVELVSGTTTPERSREALEDHDARAERRAPVLERIRVCTTASCVTRGREILASRRPTRPTTSRSGCPARAATGRSAAAPTSATSRRAA